MKNKAKPTIVQVPVDAELLGRIDRRAGVLRQTRAAFVRQACVQRLAELETADQERRYEAGYIAVPEKGGWAATSAGLLSRILPKEKW